MADSFDKNNYILYFDIENQYKLYTFIELFKINYNLSNHIDFIFNESSNYVTFITKCPFSYNDTNSVINNSIIYSNYNNMMNIEDLSNYYLEQNIEFSIQLNKHIIYIFNKLSNNKYICKKISCYISKKNTKEFIISISLLKENITKNIIISHNMGQIIKQNKYISSNYDVSFYINIKELLNFCNFINKDDNKLCIECQKDSIILSSVNKLNCHPKYVDILTNYLNHDCLISGVSIQKYTNTSIICSLDFIQQLQSIQKLISSDIIQINYNVNYLDITYNLGKFIKITYTYEKYKLP